MDPSLAPEPEGRNASFAAGVAGGPNHATSLQQNVDPMFRPDSILSLNNIPSGNGLGATDAQRRTYGGTMRPTDNGMSKSTYQQGGPLMSTYMNV